MRLSTSVTVLKASSDCRDEKLPHSLDDFIAMLERAREAVPVQYRESATVDCDPAYDYDSAYPQVVVSYERTESTEEAVARLAERKKQIDEISGGYLRWIADRQPELDEINAQLEAALPGAAA